MLGNIKSFSITCLRTVLGFFYRIWHIFFLSKERRKEKNLVIFHKWQTWEAAIYFTKLYTHETIPC